MQIQLRGRVRHVKDQCRYLIFCPESVWKLVQDGCTIKQLIPGVLEWAHGRTVCHAYAQSWITSIPLLTSPLIISDH